MIWQSRDFHGYMQYREGSKGPWQFQIIGFDTFGRHDFCRLKKADGSYDYDVPINAKDEIKINGRWYGRKNWNH